MSCPRPISQLGAAVLLAVAFLPAAVLQSQAPTAPGTIVRKDPRIDLLVSPTAKIEKLADGFAWSEGPVWDRKAGQLLFSDVPNNVIHKWKDGEGLGVFLRPSGYTGSAPFTGREPGSNGLTFDPQGRLTICMRTATAAWPVSRPRDVSRRLPTASRASASTARTTS